MELHLPPIHQQKRSSLLLFTMFKESQQDFQQVPVVVESSAAFVCLGIPSHQPRSEHDGQHFQLDLKEGNVKYLQVKNQSATKGYHAYLEVVLMKDSVWNFLDQ